jgi:hypothetical protein
MCNSDETKQIAFLCIRERVFGSQRFGVFQEIHPLPEEDRWIVARVPGSWGDARSTQKVLPPATARDIFVWQIPRLEAAGLRVVLHCHDEYVLEADHDVNIADVLALLRTPPPWAAELPVDASAWEGDCYAK